MSSFTYSLPVQADFTRLWALVRDVRRVAELFPYTAVDDFQALEPDRWLFRRCIDIPNVATLRWQEQAWTDSEGALRFEAVEGDLDTFAGLWQVMTTERGSTLSLAVEYVIPEALRPRMPLPLVEYVMGELFKSICQRMKEAVEEVSA